MTAVNRQSFLCPLSMATDYISVLLQPLGGAAHVFGVPTTARERSDWLRAQPEVVQTHGVPELILQKLTSATRVTQIVFVITGAVKCCPQFICEYWCCANVMES